MSRHLSFVIACAAALAVEFYTLAVMPIGRTTARGREIVSIDDFRAGALVTQQFTPAADGLHAIRIQLQSAAPSPVQIAWRLLERKADKFVEPGAANHGTLSVPGFTGTQWVAIEFAPIAASAGVWYALELQVAGLSAPGARQPLALVASRDRPLPLSALLVNGTERWGDLVFETRALSDTALGRLQAKVMPSLPGPLRHPAVIWAAILLFNALLIAAAFGLLREDKRPGTGDLGLRPAPVHLLSVLALLAAALAAGAWVVRDTRGRFNLLDRLYAASFDTSMPLHEAVHVEDVEIGTETKRVLFSHATSRLSWRLTVPAGGRFRTDIALHPTVWIPGGDGVLFEVIVQDAAATAELFSRHINPRMVMNHRWTPVDVDLSAYGGKDVLLTLVAETGPPDRPHDGGYDWAIWAEPRIQ